MQKFNSNNVEARFIKNILKNTYLPSIPTVTDGDYIVSGVEYCYKNDIIQCENTGILTDKGIVDDITYVKRHPCIEPLHKNHEPISISPAVSDFCICQPDFLCGIGIRTATYKVIDTIKYNCHTPGLNINYDSSSDIYDTNTHKQLGKYLRYYRDMKGIDLMPLYNCFCNETTTFINISNNEIKTGNNSNNYVWLIPAHLNKEYTLYIDSAYPVTIGSTFLNNCGRIKQYNKNNKYLDELLDNEILNYNNLSYNKPIQYKMFTNNSDLLSYDNNFYIVIQTIGGKFTPIVAIEGRHRREYIKFITNSESHNKHIVDNGLTLNYDDFSPPVYPSIIATPLSYYVPYSPRLIEFLTEQSITSEENIPNNILRIQKILNTLGLKLNENDVWDAKLKYCAYNRYFKYSNKYYMDASQLDNKHMPKNISSIPDKLFVKDINGAIIGLKDCRTKRDFDYIYDITGYIDKDIENSLFKYRGV